MANCKWCALVLVASCAAVLGETVVSTPSHNIKELSNGNNVTNPTIVTNSSIFNHEMNTSPPENTNLSSKITQPTPTPTPKTTTPTPETTTPTTKPTTPTTKPTTPTPKTTTPTPTTTNPPPETTTPSSVPTPIVPPKTGVWNVTDDTTNVTCIIVQFAVQFNVSYVAGKSAQNASINLSEDSVVTGGSCANTSEYITLSWPRQVDPENRNNFTIKFDMNITSHQYYVSQVNLSLVFNSSIFPNASSTKNMELHSVSKEWLTGLNHSYRCKREQILKLTSAEQGGETGNLAAEVLVSDVQEEAFRSEKGHQFSIAVDCDGTDLPDMVPIAVGCTLGVLVLVVLAAYMFGRRRSPARGYLSM